MRFQITPSQDCIIKGASLAPGLYGTFGIKERQSVRQHADHEREASSAVAQDEEGVFPRVEARGEEKDPCDDVEWRACLHVIKENF